MIVLVDDDPLACYGLSLFLKDCGYRVIADLSVARARAQVHDGEVPSAMIIEARTCGDSVETAISNAASLRQELGIPVVMVANSDDQEVQAAARECGLPLVSKPMDLKRLKAILEALIPAPRSVE